MLSILPERQLFSLRASDPREEKVNVKVTQSCLTLCDLTDHPVYGILQARILERLSRSLLKARILQWVSYSLLQGIFPTQGLNPGLLHMQVDSLPAEPGGKPKREQRRNCQGFHDLALDARLHHFYNILMPTSISPIHICEYKDLGFSGGHLGGWLPP